MVDELSYYVLLVFLFVILFFYVTMVALKFCWVYYGYFKILLGVTRFSTIRNLFFVGNYFVGLVNSLVEIR